MLAILTEQVETLLQPCIGGWGVLDYYAAARLSQVISTVKGERRHKVQELFGLMVVVLGPETFLSIVQGKCPGWIVSPDVVLLFAGAHILMPYIPTTPTAELFLSVPDAINRCLLVTRFSRIDGTPTLRLLAPIINAVPFAAISFGGFNFFTDMTWTAPAEVQPWGWAMVDTWIPLISLLYQYAPATWDEKEALGGCIVLTVLVFIARALYNTRS